MNEQLTYPEAAGFKEQHTSKIAAEKIEKSGRAMSIRDQLMHLFERGWVGTVYEAADITCIPYCSVQPRFSELLAQEKIVKVAQVDGPYGTVIWMWGIKP